MRKQTLVNSERFTIEALAELENHPGRGKRVVQLEYDLFCQLRDEVSSHVRRLKATAHA